MRGVSALSVIAAANLERKEDNIPELLKKVNEAIDLMGKDFDVFKQENDKRLKEVSKKGDRFYAGAFLV